LRYFVDLAGVVSPSVPSISGVPGTTRSVVGLAGPGRHARRLIAKLHELLLALDTDPVKERLGKLSASPIGVRLRN
jgi:hypothetical protein